MLLVDFLLTSKERTRGLCVCALVSTLTPMSSQKRRGARHIHEYFEHFFCFLFPLPFQLRLTLENQTGLYSNRWLSKPSCCDKSRDAKLPCPVRPLTVFDGLVVFCVVRLVTERKGEEERKRCSGRGRWGVNLERSTDGGWVMWQRVWSGRQDLGKLSGRAGGQTMTRTTGRRWRWQGRQQNVW